MKTVIPFGLVLSLSLGSPTASAQEDTFALYVGRAACAECHRESGATRICEPARVWQHSEAYQALLKPKAKHIALLNGVHGPILDQVLCLYCHTAGVDEGPRWMAPTFRIEDGVQCESCHGPGSLHAESHRVPRSEGAVPSLVTLRKPDPGQCLTCHMNKPSHREVLKSEFRATKEDDLYKTPVNLVVSPDGERLFVVCEHSNSVVVVETADRSVISEIPVGRRPHDAALSADGSRLYVTNRMSGTVSVIDLALLRVVSTIEAGSELHGIAVTPGNGRLFVADSGRNRLTVLFNDSSEQPKQLPAGVAPWAIALSSDGRRAYATNVRPNPVPFRDPPQSEITVVDAEHAVVLDRLIVEEANMLQGVSAVPGREMVLFTLMRTKNLVPTTRLAQGWTITNGLGVIWPDRRVDQVLLDLPDEYFPDPMDLAVSPDGRFALVTSGGSDQVVVIDVDRLVETIRSFSNVERCDVLPNQLGIADKFVVKYLSVGANPRGVCYSPDGRRAFVANALDDTVTVIDASTYESIGVVRLGGPEILSQLRWGERLFHSANITYGKQFSCRSCHPDGHLNGLTFDIEADGIGMSPVDNRTLRGILDTAPFKWEGINPTLHRQCGPRLAVFFTRLAPYTPEELDALVCYMSTIEAPPNPYRSAQGLTPTQRRGKVIFERRAMNDGTPLRQDQQCAYCHSGAHRTNRTRTDTKTTMWFDTLVEVELHNLFNADEYGELGTYYFIDAGLPTKYFDVAHLRNLYDSAPYLHNGAAATLEEIWTRFNMVNGHGETADLTRPQFNDLIAYLRSQ